MKTVILAIIAGAFTFAACGYAAEPAPRGLRTALEKFLKKEGYLCLGKFDWPIDVSERDSRLGTRDALQMPVLEKIGIVSSSASEKREEGAGETIKVTRYELTKTGRKSYIVRDTAKLGADGKKVVHHGDFCAGKLSLDSLVGWDAPRTAGDQLETTVAYTYKIAPADWARNPEAQKVFPMVERIIKGEGTLQLKQVFRSTKDGWEAVGP